MNTNQIKKKIKNQKNQKKSEQIKSKAKRSKKNQGNSKAIKTNQSRSYDHFIHFIKKMIIFSVKIPASNSKSPSTQAQYSTNIFCCNR